MPPFDRMIATDGALLVVDLQDRLLRAVDGRDRVVANILRLARAAALLDVPALATEQNPEKLGPSLPGLAELIPDRPAKMTFHACGAPGIVEALASGYVRHVTLVGIEAHVCVAQSALELVRLGYRVQVPADAVGSRFAVDRDFALRRLEWAESADHPRFRELSALVKERTEA